MLAATSIIDRSTRQPWVDASSIAIAHDMPAIRPQHMSTGQPVDRRGAPSSSPLSIVKPDSHCATVSMQVRESSWP